jgi:hypothetical protein
VVMMGAFSLSTVQSFPHLNGQIIL